MGKSISDYSMQDLAKAIVKELGGAEKPIGTNELSKRLGIRNSTICYYKKLGMPNHGYNSWYFSECINWIDNIYPVLLKRKKKSKAKTK